MKNFIIGALVLGCLYLFFFHKRVETITITKTSPEVDAFVKADVEDINSKISKKGFDIAVLEEVQNTVGDLANLKDSATIAFKDSMMREAKLKDKQLISVTQYNARLKDSLMMARQVNDSTFNYASNGLKLQFVHPSKDKPYFNYSYDAKVNYIEYYKKKHFLAPKKQYIDFWIEDTRATIGGVKRLKIQQKPDNFKLKINASSFYVDRVNIGFDADMEIGRYSVGGGYFYDMIEREWKPLIKAKFKLLEF